MRDACFPEVQRSEEEAEKARREKDAALEAAVEVILFFRIACREK